MRQKPQVGRRRWVFTFCCRARLPSYGKSRKQSEKPLLHTVALMFLSFSFIFELCFQEKCTLLLRRGVAGTLRRSSRIS